MKVGVVRKFICLFMPVLALALLMPGLYFVRGQKQTLVRHFDQRMNLILDYAVQELQALPGAPQRDTLEAVAARIMSQEDIVSCCLRDVNGRVMMEKGQVSCDDTASYTRTLASATGSAAQQTAPSPDPASQESVLGELSIDVSRGRLHAALNRCERVMSAAVLTSMCFVSLFFVLTVEALVARPLRALVSGMHAITRQGNLFHRIYMDHEDEFGQLAGAFNQMADELKQVVVRDRDLESVAEHEHKRALVLGKANRDLDHINKELRDFAQIVSHDLKAPLRGIRSLTDWIVNDYGDQFDEEGKAQVGLLAGRVQRMENLIDGILEYSRAGYHCGTCEDVDLNRIIADVIEDIAPPRHIHISVKNTLPIVHLHKTKIIQVFQNLISNAVKYNDKPIGVISVNYQDQGDLWQFSVTDNGIGIKEQHYERIFNIFETLSSQERPDSTGVGLAVVKRIIEGWGGRIWVRSRVGEGSIFVFTLLKQIERVHHEKYQTSIAT